MASLPCAFLKCKSKVCLHFQGNLSKVIVYGIPLMAFLCQFYFHLNYYVQRPTMFTSREVTEYPAMFPPITLCTFPAFNPFRLRHLGLNFSVSTSQQLAFNIENLVGIDSKLTGYELVNEAAWRPEDLIEEVMVGDVHLIYNVSHKYGRLWERSFTPIGPCLTLTPPSLASLTSKTLVLKLRSHSTDLNKCIWREEGIAKQYQGPEDCLAVQQHCNRSCIWEQYIDNNKKISFTYVGSTSPSLNIHLPSTDLRLLNNSQLELFPFKIIHLNDAKIKSKNCLYNCLVKDPEKANRCKGLFNETLAMSVRDLCVTQSQQYKMTHEFIFRKDKLYFCRRSCMPNKRESQWITEGNPSNLKPFKNTFILNLVTITTTEICEREVYPLSQFMSDIGGTLGLFLGISLLDIWNILVHVSKLLTNNFPINSVSKSVFTLGMLSGKLTVSMMACTHIGLSLFQYGHQSKHIEISLKLREYVNTSDFMSQMTPDKCKKITSEETCMAKFLVETHLASRPLGCRIPTHHGCLVKCILRKNIDLPLPLVSIDDLPFCSEEHLTLPKVKYIPPIQIFVETETVRKCHLECENSSGLIMKNRTAVDFDIQEEFDMSWSHLICSIGAIIGLYYGISLLKFGPCFQSFYNKQFTNKLYIHILKVFRITAIGISVFTVTTLIILQCKSYIFYQPISTSMSRRLLEYNDLPAVTVCVWPPFNVQLFLEAFGQKEVYDHIVNQNLMTYHSSVLSLLQTLSDDPNSTILTNMWNRSSWNVHRNLPIICNDCLNKTDFIFDSCHTYARAFSKEEIGVKPLNWKFKSPYRTNIHFSIHNREDFPLVESDKMVEGNLDFRFSQFSSWSRSHSYTGKSQNRVKCVLECLKGSFRDQRGCVLPWAVTTHDTPVCNMNQYIKLLIDIWSHGPRPQHIYSALLGTRAVDACNHKCQQSSLVFYDFHINGENYMTQLFAGGYSPKNNRGISINLTPIAKSFRSVSIYKRYPLSRLLSDIGGIVGMTLGISMASLMQAIANVLQ